MIEGGGMKSLEEFLVISAFISVKENGFRLDFEIFNSLAIDLGSDAHRVFDGIEIMESVQSCRKED